MTSLFIYDARIKEDEPLKISNYETLILQSYSYKLAGIIPITNYA